MSPNKSVEPRGQGYYLAGTRISLDSIAYALRRGETAEDIHADLPALSSREKLEGAIAFIKENQLEVDAYLAKNERRWDEARKLNPPEMVEKLQRYRAGQVLKSA